MGPKERLAAALTAPIVAFGATSCGEQAPPPQESSEVTLYCQQDTDSADIPPDTGQEFAFRSGTGAENKGALLGSIALRVVGSEVFFKDFHTGVGGHTDLNKPSPDKIEWKVVYQETWFILGGSAVKKQDGQTVLRAHCGPISKPPHVTIVP